MSTATLTASSQRTTLWQALALPLLLLAAWQLWAFTLPPDTRAPYPTKVLTTFYALAASGDLPMALLQSLSRLNQMGCNAHPIPATAN